MDLIDHVDKYICAYKIGSGDISWIDALKKCLKIKSR